MLCRSCGKEIFEDSSFCNHCGKKIANNYGNKKKLLILSVTSLIVIISLILFVYLNTDLSKFKRMISSGDVVEASNLYKNEISKSQTASKKAEVLISDNVNKIVEEYINEEIEYENAIEELARFKKVGIVTNSIDDVNKQITEYNISRKSFKQGEEFFKKNDFAKALEEYKKVIKEDKNFEKAELKVAESTTKLKENSLLIAEDEAKNNNFSQAIIEISTALEFLPEDDVLIATKEDYINKYVTQSITEADKYYGAGEIDEAISLMNNLLSYKPNDKLILDKKNSYLNKQLEIMEANQELRVVTTNITSDWLHDEMAQVIVKNNSNKTVKKYEVSMMAYDKNGFPVKIGWLSPDFEHKGNAEQNIQPNEVFGYGSGWDIDNSDANTLLACVISVEYYDGSIWTNPYYDYWKKEHLEIPLK